MTPKQTDTALAALWHELHEIDHRIASTESALKSYAGARYYYRGRRRVTDTTIDDALAILADAMDAIDAYKATHSTTESDGYVSTDWREYSGVVKPYEHDRVPTALAKRAELIAERETLLAKIDELEATYTGWSRFFLVTSSAGHVHSSTYCSTCRPTTMFGWLPELSGKTERVAVDELGPTLCSVCFPSAPLDWTTGKKLTATQAARKAA